VVCISSSKCYINDNNTGLWVRTIHMQESLCDVKEMMLVIKPCTYKSASEWGLPFVPTLQSLVEGPSWRRRRSNGLVGRAMGGDDDK